MIRNTLLGLQIKRLLSALAAHGGAHLAEIDSDLAQTDILLGEAIEKLGASFMAIHEAVTAQQEAVDALLSGATPTPELAERLKARQAEIGLHVNAAITGLQFQDMTSQLIGRSVRRVVGLRDVLTDAAEGVSDMPAESSIDDIVATLNKVNSTLEQQGAKLESELWKAVCQTHMESGDVELF